MSMGRVVGFVVGALLTFAVGYAIFSRIPGAMALLTPKAG